MYGPKVHGETLRSFRSRAIRDNHSGRERYEALNPMREPDSTPLVTLVMEPAEPPPSCTTPMSPRRVLRLAPECDGFQEACSSWVPMRTTQRRRRPTR